MTEQERAALERELVDHLERTRQICKALGLDPIEATAPLKLRIDAWLHRARQLVPDPFYPAGTEW